jgi:radical SAM protein with 4Fe4S-binding SPASM domain
LSREKILEILDFAKSKNVKSIKLSGGEPFLYKEYLSLILNFAHNNNIRVSIETNGTLLDEEFIKNNHSEEISYSLSLDSSIAKEHDRFRGLQGAFSKTVETIQLLVKYGARFNITYSTYDGDETQIDKMVKFAKEHSISNLKINPIIKMGRAEHFDQSEYVTTISPQKILELYSKYCVKSNNGVVVSIMVPPALSGFYFLKDVANKCPENICSNCPTLNILSILPNGDVGLCAEAYRSNDLKFGNIYESPLDEIWDGELLNEFRNKVLYDLQGVCRDCLVKEICWGGCRALALKKYGKVNSPNPFCEYFNNNGKFILKTKLDK